MRRPLREGQGSCIYWTQQLSKSGCLSQRSLYLNTLLTFPWLCRWINNTPKQTVAKTLTSGSQQLMIDAQGVKIWSLWFMVYVCFLFKMEKTRYAAFVHRVCVWCHTPGVRTPLPVWWQEMAPAAVPVHHHPPPTVAMPPLVAGGRGITTGATCTTGSVSLGPTEMRRRLPVWRHVASREWWYDSRVVVQERGGGACRGRGPKISLKAQTGRKQTLPQMDAAPDSLTAQPVRVAPAAEAVRQQGSWISIDNDEFFYQQHSVCVLNNIHSFVGILTSLSKKRILLVALISSQSGGDWRSSKGRSAGGLGVEGEGGHEVCKPTRLVWRRNRQPMVW